MKGKIHNSLFCSDNSRLKEFNFSKTNKIKINEDPMHITVCQLDRLTLLE